MEEHSIPRNKCKITFLGTGTSSGVPQIGCSCKVCTSNDPRDRRMRCSSLVEVNGTRILIDCGPDFYFQMLKIPFGQINGVLVTHEHYDHVGGLDDLRPFCRFGTINIYGNDVTLKHLHDRIPYCFKEHLYRGVPHLNLVEVTPHKEFSINGVNVIPLRVMHGNMEILGYDFNHLIVGLPISEFFIYDVCKSRRIGISFRRGAFGGKCSAPYIPPNAPDG